MNLQQVISSGKNFKRSSKDMWLKTVNGIVITTGAMLLYELNSDDILADDWEIETSEPTQITIIDSGDNEIVFAKDFDGSIHIDSSEFGVQMMEKDVDKILTFLYNNTEIGKSRITPF